MTQEGKGLCKRNFLIELAWYRLFIAITTTDINEFYQALGKNAIHEGKKHYTWDMANNSKKINKSKGGIK